MSCGVEVPLGSECDPGTARLEHRVVGALSSYGPQGVEVPCIQVSRLVVLGSWAPPKGIPLTSHYLSLEITLDITVMAESDPLLDCPRCPRSPLCSALPRCLLCAGHCGGWKRVYTSPLFAKCIQPVLISVC